MQRGHKHVTSCTTRAVANAVATLVVRRAEANSKPLYLQADVMIEDDSANFLKCAFGRACHCCRSLSLEQSRRGVQWHTHPHSQATRVRHHEVVQ